MPCRFLYGPVWRVLNANEFKALFRILEEHQRHGGYVNDGLPVTKKDFVNARIHPKHMTSSLLVLEKLGIIKCTKRMKGTSSGGLPNLWRPTFLPTTPKANDATHDYAKFATVAEARR